MTLESRSELQRAERDDTGGATVLGSPPFFRPAARDS